MDTQEVGMGGGVVGGVRVYRWGYSMRWGSVRIQRKGRVWPNKYIPRHCTKFSFPDRGKHRDMQIVRIFTTGSKFINCVVSFDESSIPDCIIESRV